MVEYPNAPEPAPSQPPAPAPASSPAPAPAPRTPASGGSSRGTTILFLVAGLVAVGGIAFAVGRLTAPTASAATGRFGTTGAFRGEFGATASSAPGAARGFFGGGLGGGAADLSLQGTVQSISGNTMTLRTANGDTVTVDLTGATAYHRQAAASASDVTTGSQVLVQVQFNRTAFGAGAAASGAPFGGGAGAGGGTSAGGAAPLASAAPRTFTASDVTLVAP